MYVCLQARAALIAAALFIAAYCFGTQQIGSIWSAPYSVNKGSGTERLSAQRDYVRIEPALSAAPFQAADGTHIIYGSVGMEHDGLCQEEARSDSKKMGSSSKSDRLQIVHNMYYILAGIMLWPLLFLLVLFLANRYDCNSRTERSGVFRTLRSALMTRVSLVRTIQSGRQVFASVLGRELQRAATPPD